MKDKEDGKGGQRNPYDDSVTYPRGAGFVPARVPFEYDRQMPVAVAMVFWNFTIHRCGRVA